MGMNARYEHDLFEVHRRTSDGEGLRRYLSEKGRCRVELALTRNRVSMISVVFVKEGYARVRLHEQFLNAPPSVHQALAGYLCNRRRAAWAVVADYARSIPVHAAPAPSAAQRRPLATAGQVHNLREIADEVNARFFSGRISCRLGWGARRDRPRRRGRSRSIRYGSWSPSTRTLRVSPLLDDGRVPRVFVAYIIFHEMLHAVVPSEVVGGRRRDHGATFRKLERLYPDLARMQQLGRQLLDVLLAPPR